MHASLYLFYESESAPMAHAYTPMALAAGDFVQQHARKPGVYHVVEVFDIGARRHMFEVSPVEAPLIVTPIN